MNLFCLGKPPKHQLGQWIATLTVSFCFFSSGMSVGWTSPAFHKVRVGEVSLELSDLQMSLLAAIPFFSRLLSPLPSSYVMDRAGRRGCLAMGRVLQIVHWFMMYASYNIWVMYLARFLSGWYSGMGAFITGVYVCETAHKRHRGRMQALLNVNFLLGTVFVSVVGSLVSYDSLAIISGAVDLATFALMFVIPETPYFHLKNGRYEEAEVCLKWLRGSDDVGRELHRVDKYIKQQMSHRNTYSFIFLHKASRRAFVIVLTLMILQRSSGLVAIVSFSSFITPDTWWLPNDKGPIALNATYLAMCLLSSLFVDKYGRKTLLVFSTSGTFLFLLGCTIWFFLDYTQYTDVSGTEWIPIVLLILQAAFYSTGFCFIPALLMSEMFPMNIKAKSNALGAMTATFFSMIIVFSFLPVTNALGMYANFVFYTLTTFLAALYSTTIVETKGKTLETIQAHLEGRIASDSSIYQTQTVIVEEPDEE